MNGVSAPPVSMSVSIAGGKNGISTNGMDGGLNGSIPHAAVVAAGGGRGYGY